MLDGYNVSIFAYGQTGTGKTFTINGLIATSFDELYKVIHHRSYDHTYQVQLSMLEIYNEQAYDLLTVNKAKLDVSLPSNIRVCIPNQTWAAVANASDIKGVIEQGFKNRSVGATDMNEHSSRSHWYDVFVFSNFVVSFLCK